MVKMYRTKEMGAVAALAAGDLLFFSLSDPQTSSPFVVVIGCCLLVVTIYVVTVALMWLISWGIPLRKVTRKRLALFVTMLSAFLVLMQSIGQLTMRDGFAVLPLMLIAYLYITYNRTKQAG